YAVGGGDDVSGDGVADYLVGAPGHDSYKGAAYVFFGPISGSQVTTDADLVFLGTTDSTLVGVGLNPVGDLDGDGQADLGIGTNTDGFYIFAGPVATTTTFADAAIRVTSKTNQGLG